MTPSIGGWSLQADNLAALSVDEAAARLVLDWSRPVDHAVFYKSVFRPTVLRAESAGFGVGCVTGLRAQRIHENPGGMGRCLPWLVIGALRDLAGRDSRFDFMSFVDEVAANSVTILRRVLPVP